MKVCTSCLWRESVLIPLKIHTCGNDCIAYSGVSFPFSPERGEGHDRQNEPTEDQLCHPQQWPLDRPSFLQPPGGQQDLQGDEEDGEQHEATVHP